MKLALLYIGMVLGGYALHYADMRIAAFACAFFVQATSLLLVATRPKEDEPKIGFGMGFGVAFFIGMGFAPLSYSAVPVLPLVLALAAGWAMHRMFLPKPVFS